MITFPCNNCREELSVPSDLAGGEIQCPTCGWLASVPLLSDLPNLRPDGTHGVLPSVEREETNRLEGLVRTFGTRRVDGGGEEIDNRTLPDAIDLAPMPPPPARPAPRYDPETGERLDPLELKREAPIPAVPIGPLARPGPPPVGYATPGKTELITHASVWLDLFSPGNAAVMLAVFIAHVLWAVVDMFIVGVLKVAVLAGGPSLVSWPLNLSLWLALAHYANVIFEVGEAGHDSLARPLRDFNLGEDFFHPLLRFLSAFVFCFAPAWAAVYLPGQATPILFGMLLLLGSFVFPAALIAACGSNALANLRPDRLLNVIRAGRWAHLRLSLLTAFVVPIYGWSVAGFGDLIWPLIRDTPAAPIARRLTESLWARIPVMFLVIIIAHGICWRLGQLQRANQGKFGWLWDVHEVERQAERRRRQEAREQAARNRRSTSTV